MNRLSVIIATALLPLCDAHARLGQTEAQMEARYGQPISKTDMQDVLGTDRIYRTAGVHISVTFVDGICQVEWIQKDDESPLSDKEVHTPLSTSGSQVKDM